MMTSASSIVRTLVHPVLLLICLTVTGCSDTSESDRPRNDGGIQIDAPGVDVKINPDDGVQVDVDTDGDGVSDTSVGSPKKE